ncbi:MAG: hypothetical protein NT080_05190 [Spirochaetes bacterium]|nr:hypothetical protein [Spirochaetota bacterium]
MKTDAGGFRLGRAAIAAAVALLILGSVSAAPAAVPGTLPPMEPAAWAVEAARAPDPMPPEAFTKAALDFSGSGGSERRAADEILQRLLADSVAGPGALPDPYARGEALLAFLHDRVLRAYSARETGVDAALLRGSFNCVSSAVLYAAFAKAAGLAVGGVVTADHAFCSVFLAPGRTVDVETTNASGFEPGTKKAFVDSFGKATGYSYVPPGAYSGRKPVGERELLSLILRNRATLAEGAGRWDDAFALAADVHAFLGTVESREYLDGRFSNLVSALNETRSFTPALEFIAAFESRYGADTKTRELRVLTSHNALADHAGKGRWEEGAAFAESLIASGMDDERVREFLRASVLNPLADLVRAKAWDNAEALLRRAGGRLPPEMLETARRSLREARVTDTVRTRPFAEADAVAAAAFADGTIDAARYREFVEYLYDNAANESASRSDWLAAAAVLERGLAKVPGSAILIRNLEAMRNNWIAETHNRFAALYNAGRFAEAEALVERALALQPGAKRLVEDLELARKALE